MARLAAIRPRSMMTISTMSMMGTFIGFTVTMWMNAMANRFQNQNDELSPRARAIRYFIFEGSFIVLPATMKTPFP